MASLGTLTADLVLQIAQWSDPLDKAEQDLVKFHDSVKRNVDDIAGEVAKFAAEAVVGFTTFKGALAEVAQAFAGAQDWGKSLDLLARSTGEPVEKLDDLALSAKLSDVSVSELSTALDKLGKSMVAARTPTSDMAAVFDALKVDPGTADNMRGTVDVMKDVVAAIAAIPDPALRAATAMTIFGKGGAEMATKLAQIAEESRKAQDAIAAFGPVTDAQAAASKSLGDSFDLFGEAAMRIAGPIEAALAPVFANMVKALEALMAESTGAAAAIGTSLAVALEILAGVLVAAVTGLQTLLVLLYGVAQAVNALATGQLLQLGPIVDSTFGKLASIAEGAGKALTVLWGPAVKSAGDAAKSAAPDVETLDEAIRRVADGAGQSAASIANLAVKWSTIFAAQDANVAPATIKGLQELDALFDKTHMSQEDYDRGLQKLMSDDPIIAAEQSKITDAIKKTNDELDKATSRWAILDTAQAAGLAPETVKSLQDLSNEFQHTSMSADEYAKRIDAILTKDPVLAAEQKAVAESTGDVQKAVDAISAENKALADQIHVMGMTDAARDQYIAGQKDQELLDTALAKLAKDTVGDPAAYDRLSTALKAYVAALAAERAGLIASADAQKQYYAIVDAQKAHNVDLAQTVQLQGLEGTAREQKILDLAREKIANADATTEEKAAAAAIFDTTQNLIDQEKAFQANQQSMAAWADVFKTIDGYGKSFYESFAKGMQGVKDWAKQAGDAIKKYLLDTLYEATLKPFIVNVVQQVATTFGAQGANVAGGASLANQGSNLAQLASLFGGSNSGATFSGSSAGGGLSGQPTSDIGTLAGAGGSLVQAAGGVGGVAGLFGAGGGAFAAAAGSSLAASSATLGIAATAGAEAVGGLAAVAGSLVAFVPVVGAILAVGYLAYTMLAQQAGGPKAGGYAVSGDASAGGPSERFFSPNDSDAAVQKLTTGISDAFASTLAGLGGTGQAAFALGYDTDPQGTAGSRVSSAAYVGGKQIYATHDVDVGRDDKAVQAQLQTETERLLLAALQASDLPQSMARILNTVAAATASATDVANVIALAGAFKQASDVAAAMVNPMDAAAQAINTAGESAIQQYEAQRDAFNKLAESTPPTTEGLIALSNAAGDLYKSTVALLAGMVQLKQQISGMFGDTRENIVRSTMDTPTLYEHIRQQTQGLYTQLQGATDPADINRITAAINANINQEWGMLTPEQQKQSQSEFLAGLDNVSALAQQRIDASIQSVEDQSNTDQANLTDTLNKILDSITGAASDFKSGAEDVSKAATTGYTVNVRVTDDRATAEVTG